MTVCGAAGTPYHRGNPDARRADRTVRESMIVEQIWTANNYRNFNYLIVCPETGDWARKIAMVSVSDAPRIWKHS